MKEADLPSILPVVWPQVFSGQVSQAWVVSQGSNVNLGQSGLKVVLCSIVCFSVWWWLSSQVIEQKVIEPELKAVWQWLSDQLKPQEKWWSWQIRRVRAFKATLWKKTMTYRLTKEIKKKKKPSKSNTKNNHMPQNIDIEINKKSKSRLWIYSTSSW